MLNSRWSRAGRTAAQLAGILLLATCGGSDTPTGSSRSGSASVDASAMVALADSFHIQIDRIVVEVRESGSGASLVSKTFGGADLAVRPLLLKVTAPLTASPEAVTIAVSGFDGVTEFYSGTITANLTDGGTVTPPAVGPVYDGPGSDADSMAFALDTAIQSGDSVLLVATALKSNGAVAGVPVEFISSNPVAVQIHRPASQPFNRAWAFGSGAGPGSAAITARLPNSAGVHVARQLGLVERAASLTKVAGDHQNLVTWQTALPIRVAVKTATSHPFAGQTVAFTVSGPPGVKISPSSAQTDSNGEALTNLQAGSGAGNVTITARATHGTVPLAGAPATFAETIALGRVASFVAVTPDSQAGVVDGDAAVPPAVMATDSNSMPLAGVGVDFSQFPCGCQESIDGTQGTVHATTGADGVASLHTWHLGTVSQWVYLVYAGGLSFEAIAAPGPANEFDKVAGDNQTGHLGSALPVPLKVIVRDAWVNPVPGAVVNWSTSSGGSFAPATSISDSSGAVSTVWTLGSGPDHNQIAQVTSGVFATGAFNATGISGSTPMALVYPGVPNVGTGLQAQVRLALSTPAPVGGTFVVLSSDDPAIASPMYTPNLHILAGDSTADFIVYGGAVGSTTLRADADGFAEGTLPITTEERQVQVSSFLTLAVGDSVTLEFQLPAPAPPGGVTFAINSSDTTTLTISTDSVTIPGGGQTGSLIVTRIKAGYAAVGIWNPAYGQGTSEFY